MTYGTVLTLTRSLILSLGVVLLSAVGLRSTTLRLPFVPMPERLLSPLPRSLGDGPHEPWYAMLARGLQGGRRSRPGAVAPVATAATAAGRARPVGVAWASDPLAPSLRPLDEAPARAEQRGPEAALPAPALQPVVSADDPLLVLAMTGETQLPPACGPEGCLLRRLRRPLDGGVDDQLLGARFARAAASRMAGTISGDGGSVLGPLSALFSDPEAAGGGPASAAGGRLQALRAQTGGPTWSSRAQAIHSL